MKHRLYFLTVLFAACLFRGAARADVIEYTLPGTSSVITLQGRVTVNPGGTLSYRHPKFGAIHLGLRDCKIHRAEALPKMASRRRIAAAASGEADQMLEAAVWALKHGLLDEFHVGIDEVLKLDPKNDIAVNIKNLQRGMRVAIADSPKQREYMRNFVSLPEMKFEESPHYVLLHDTPATRDPDTRQTRAQSRLRLLERVYETFMYLMYSQGIYPALPRTRLMVVLFAEHDDYLHYVSRISPALRSASGFWNSETNIAFFFDQGTSKDFATMLAQAAKFEEMKKKALLTKAPDTADVVRLANTYQMLVKIERENLDVEVVTHEATHQLAGNTGILPRNANVPIWVHEGLATYFEAPADGVWSGIGAVNQQRLTWYRALEQDTRHSNIDFIASDRIFQLAASASATLHGYGQAWALTHFLMENHFEQFMKYYAAVGKAAVKGPLTPEQKLAIFYEVFGGKMAALNREWREYMRGLKTDLEVILEE